LLHFSSGMLFFFKNVLTTEIIAYHDNSRFSEKIVLCK